MLFVVGICRCAKAWQCRLNSDPLWRMSPIESRTHLIAPMLARCSLSKWCLRGPMHSPGQALGSCRCCHALSHGRRRQHAGAALVLEPIALALNGNHGRVMEQPNEHLLRPSPSRPDPTTRGSGWRSGSSRLFHNACSPPGRTDWPVRESAAAKNRKPGMKIGCCRHG